MAGSILVISHSLMNKYPGIVPVLSDFQNFNLRQNQAIFSSNFGLFLDIDFRPPSYLRDDWSDSHDIAQSGEDISWGNARLVGFSKFQF